MKKQRPITTQRAGNAFLQAAPARQPQARKPPVLFWPVPKTEYAKGIICLREGAQRLPPPTPPDTSDMRCSPQRGV